MYIGKDPLMEQISIQPRCGTVNCAYLADPTRVSSGGVHMCTRCVDVAQDRKWKRETGRMCLRCGKPPPLARTPRASTTKRHVCVPCGMQLLGMWPNIRNQAQAEATFDAKYPAATFEQFILRLIQVVAKNNEPLAECKRCKITSNTAEALGGKCSRCALQSCLRTGRGCPPLINLLECPCGLVFPSSSPVPRLCTSCNTRIGKHVAGLVEQGVKPFDFNPIHDALPIESDYYDIYSDEHTRIAADVPLMTMAMTIHSGSV